MFISLAELIQIPEIFFPPEYMRPPTGEQINVTYIVGHSERNMIAVQCLDLDGNEILIRKR